jgi:hypothetical protein
VDGISTLASTTATANRRPPARTPGLINLRHMTKMLLSCFREESKLCSELPIVQGCELFCCERCSVVMNRAFATSFAGARVMCQVGNFAWRTTASLHDDVIAVHK